MNPILLRYVGFALVAVIAGAGGGYLAVNKKTSPPPVTQSGTVPAIPAQPYPGQGIPAIPATPAIPQTKPSAQTAPVIEDITPKYGFEGTAITLIGTGFTSTENTIEMYSDINHPATISGLTSANGTSLTFTLPSPRSPLQLDGCEVGPYRCLIRIINKGGTSNQTYFSVLREVESVKVVSPNGGEVFALKTGWARTMKVEWSGQAFSAMLVNKDANLDDTSSIQYVGFLGTNSFGGPYQIAVWGTNSIAWDGIVCSYPVGCRYASPGQYKIMLYGQNELGTVEERIIDGTSFKNWDLSDQSFTITVE